MAQKQRARKPRKRLKSDELIKNENEIELSVRSASDADSDSDSGHGQTQPESPIISNPTNDESRKRKKSKSDGEDSRTRVRVSKEDENVPKSANRVWSEDDEIAILEGMIDYQLKKGTDPYSDLATFYEFFKNSLNAAVSKTQFTDKIRKLKHKYENKLVNPVFSRPHDQILFELSTKIWGSVPKEVDINGKVRSRKEKKEEAVGNTLKEKKKKEKEEIGENKYPYLCEAWRSESFMACSKEMVKHDISLIGSEKASEMNKEWKEVRVMELKLFAKKLELMKKHTRVLLDEMTASQP